MNDVRLSDLKQWVAWKRVDRPNGLPSKIPINPYTGRAADKTNPAHWGTLAQACNRARRSRLDGIGFCLTLNDPFIVIDLDGAIVDGKPSALAIELMKHFSSYTEYSPSGNGLHIWLKSDEQVNRNMKKAAGIEIYSHDSFITFTTQRYPFTPKHIATGSVSWLVERYAKPKPAPQQAEHRHSRQLPIDDSILWDKIFKHDITQRLRPLHDGDLTRVGGDHSQAVIVLLNTLAWYTNGDQARMRRMMEQTGLPQDKWTAKRGNGDWLDWRIADACKFVGV
jgi:putative DNA primase/helicase